MEEGFPTLKEKLFNKKNNFLNEALRHVPQNIKKNPMQNQQKMIGHSNLLKDYEKQQFENNKEIASINSIQNKNTIKNNKAEMNNNIFDYEDDTNLTSNSDSEDIEPESGFIDRSLNESWYNRDGYKKYLLKCKRNNQKPLDFETWKKRNIGKTVAAGVGAAALIGGGIYLGTRKKSNINSIPKSSSNDSKSVTTTIYKNENGKDVTNKKYKVDGKELTKDEFDALTGKINNMNRQHQNGGKPDIHKPFSSLVKLKDGSYSVRTYKDFDAYMTDDSEDVTAHML